MNAEAEHAAMWPALDWQHWQATADTLHMMTQIVGKTRLALTPLQNHWWNIPLYVTARGLSTSAMPLPEGDLLDIEFDLVAHRLVFRQSTGVEEMLALYPESIAAFFARYMAMLRRLGVDCTIDSLPVELKTPIRFEQDTIHAAYDPEAVTRFWRVLSRADTLFKRFSTNFYGKISPVHFFWGSFDLAVTRFNGQTAPLRPEADAIQAEAYSHACISAGFWPGNGGYGQAAFYSYAAPMPEGLADRQIAGPGFFSKELGEFLLHYDDVRRSSDPDQTVLDFLSSTYAAAADTAGWDRASLDRHDAIAEASIRMPVR